ncbi:MULTISPECIES: pyruvate kinase [Staphylococcus]|jgi:pyruvate kinase|uniref:Pyruvate kinase n=4 Tax=Staphylococcus TaxID=1279 RepID=A0A3S7GXU8_STAHO|nr:MULTISPECIES: pyruvate kinase [Staphylococcus]EUZ70595.1 pyruvate kinase [Staphylococcus sp. M0480]OFK81883.1 pyruvate kinase [Staphylococcus sp. HMSC057A02]OFM59179.1 pyruvate kinase [Staphylococcus sp. HMSC059G05]OFM62380.1 pyruvate kinase [Staphylococcus sp. HMSC068D07]OFM77415.1 pyruvate kinase [Staphylococcus sp. HMSC074B09]OFN12923.1 pyruvate kinase [Staphylococcus sp. HMSC058D09]OFR10602.1 pyruvate kinase [Staphylococcus sp. HMSC078E07]OFR37667.1 pyruvate kinase [Staphylococcus sp
MRKTKIVCTIGPASESEEMLEKLMNAGMNVARLNFSHGSHEEHKARIDSIRKVSKKLGKTIGILLDTKGPEIRTHDMKDGLIVLEKGKEVIVSMSQVEGTPEKFSVTYEDLINDVQIGSYILLDDGLVELQVKDIDKDKGEVKCDILNTGELKNKKGVNLPGVKVNLPGITDKDAADIKFGIKEDIDYIAASFVRRPSDVLDIREILEQENNDNITIFPKIENQEGIDNIEEILEVSDGLMVARGDMGVEIPPESVPIVQKDLIRKCNKLGKPVITATQMLDSMQRNPRATRAEASDVANAIYDGTDAVMLSGETAAGQYPEEAVKTMRNIAISAEAAQDYKKLLSDRTKLVETSLVNAIGVSVAHTALNLNVKAIVAATESGSTAITISKYRPHSDIIAVTPSEHTARQLALVWGAYPVVKKGRKTTDDLLNNAVATAVATEKVGNGDLIIITAGVPTGEKGTTNMMKLHLVGDEIAKGQGVGRGSTTGKTVISKTASDLEGKDLSESIIVTNSVDESYVPYVEKAAGLITEENGITSPSAIVGLEQGIPTIIGVENATKELKNDLLITVDANQGRIFEGYANVL